MDRKFMEPSISCSLVEVLTSSPTFHKITQNPKISRRWKQFWKISRRIKVLALCLIKSSNCSSSRFQEFENLCLISEYWEYCSNIFRWRSHSTWNVFFSSREAEKTFSFTNFQKIISKCSTKWWFRTTLSFAKIKSLD